MIFTASLRCLFLFTSSITITAVCLTTSSIAQAFGDSGNGVSALASCSRTRKLQKNSWDSVERVVHVVAMWYILRAQIGSHVITLGPKYILYSYMDPLGVPQCEITSRAGAGYRVGPSQCSTRCRVGFWDLQYFPYWL